MDLLESKYINNDSWRYFQSKLSELSKDSRWIDLMKNIKLKCDCFGLTIKWQDKVSNIEDELKMQMKVHLAFYNNDYPEIAETFNSLPLFIQYLILVYFEYFTSNIIQYTPEEKNEFLRDIAETKKVIALRCFHFCEGHRDTPIPIKRMMALLDFDCFNPQSKKDKFVLDFFNMYLNNKEVKQQMAEEFDEDYMNYVNSRFFSSKAFLDLYKMQSQNVASFVTPDLFFNKPKPQPEATPDEEKGEQVEEAKAKLITG